MKQTILTIMLTLTGMTTTLYGQTVLNSDTTSTAKPIIGVQFSILMPAIAALPFSTTARVEEVSSTPEKIHTIVEVSVPKVHYVIGLLIKYKKHMALAGVIFRPHFSINEGLIEAHPNKYKFYNFKEYTWGGLYVEYGYQLFNKKNIQNYLSPGLFYYSYTTHEYDNPSWGLERVTVNSYGATVSNILQIKIKKKICLQIQPAFSLYSFNYRKREELKGIRTYFQITGGITVLISQ